MISNQLTIVGNLVDDPELRFTQSGRAVASFRIASTPRVYRDGEWVDGDALFLTVNVWQQLAEHVAGSAQRGTRVVVTGQLKQRSFETKEGEKRTVYELTAEEVALSLAFAEYERVETRQQSKQNKRAEHKQAPVKRAAKKATPTRARSSSRASSQDEEWSPSGYAETGYEDDEPPF